MMRIPGQRRIMVLSGFSYTQNRLPEGITFCNTNTADTQTTGLIYAIRGFYPTAASVDGVQCTKTSNSGLPLYEQGNQATLEDVGSPGSPHVTQFHDCKTRTKTDVQVCTNSRTGATCTTTTTYNCISTETGGVWGADVCTVTAGPTKSPSGCSSSGSRITCAPTTTTYVPSPGYNPPYACNNLSTDSNAYYVTLKADAKVCDTTSPAGLESNCQLFGSTYKPRGLLQRFGLNIQGSTSTAPMYFGLMTGSYTANTSGGLLRSKLTDMANEIDITNGTIKSSSKIIANINRFKIVEYGFPSSGQQNCSGIADGTCRSWGNPMGEMYYEAMRYFAGKSAARPEFNISDTSWLGLTYETSWDDPYTTGGSSGTGFPYCSKPFVLMLSDVYPSFDSAQLPGVSTTFDPPPATMTNDITGFPGASSAITLSGMNDLETDGSGTKVSSGINVFIGQSGASSDNQCAIKSFSNFSEIRGSA